MTTGTGRASGKLILVGEHAVVHGEPALAFAVDRGTTVHLASVDGPTTVDLPSVDPRLQAAVEHVVGPTGWRVSLSSDLPVGRGMGSSASLAVALVRAHDDATGAHTDAYARALEVERLFHGTPSGVDVAVAVAGGVLRFQRTDPPTRQSLPAPSWQAVVLDSGSAGDTGALVAAVGARRPGIDPQLRRIGELVEAAQQALDDPQALGPLLDENQALLEAIGVSTPRLEALVGLARRHGALGAKLSGAGGGGVVLALVDDPAPLLAAAAAEGVDAWVVRPAPGAPA